MNRLLSTIVAALLPAIAFGQTQPEPYPNTPVFHLRVVGNLECSQDARSIKAVFDEAAKARSPLLVLDLDGNTSRLDLVWEIGKAVRESSLPTAAFLGDPDDNQVGPGQLCIGLLSGSCTLSPGVKVRGAVNSPVLATLAPDKTAWAALTSELYEWLSKSAAGQRAPEGACAAIVSPTQPFWVVANGGSSKVVAEKPVGNDAAPLVIAGPDGQPIVGVDAKTLAQLKLTTEPDAHWSAIPARLNVKSSARVERVLTIGLSQQSAKVAPLLDAIEKADDQAKAALKLPWPAAKNVASITYHQAAAKATAALKNGQDALVSLEKLLQDYPELMRRPAPDQTEIGNKPSSYAARWRSLVQTNKDRLAKLAATTDKFAQVKD